MDFLSYMVAESDVAFDEDVSANRGPREFCIPIDKNRIAVRIVTGKDNELDGIGVQFVLHDEVVLTQKFRSKMDLKGRGISTIKLTMQQVMGAPANDGKQQLVLVGIPGPTCICECPACTLKRENWDTPIKRMWNLMVERGLQVGDCPHKDQKKKD